MANGNAIRGVWGGGPAEIIGLDDLTAFFAQPAIWNSVDVLQCSDYVTIATFGVAKSNTTISKIGNHSSSLIYINAAAHIIYSDDDETVKLADNIVKRHSEYAGLTYLIFDLRMDYTTGVIQTIHLINHIEITWCGRVIDNALSTRKSATVLHSHNGVWEKLSVSVEDIRKMGPKYTCGKLYSSTSTGDECTLIAYTCQLSSDWNLWGIRQKPSQRTMNSLHNIMRNILMHNPEHIYIIGIIDDKIAPQPYVHHLLHLDSLIPAEKVVMYLQEPADDSDLAYND